MRASNSDANVRLSPSVRRTLELLATGLHTDDVAELHTDDVAERLCTDPDTTGATSPQR